MAIPGQIIAPPKDALIITGGRLKAVLFYYFKESPSRRFLSYGFFIYFLWAFHLHYRLLCNNILLSQNNDYIVRKRRCTIRKMWALTGFSTFYDLLTQPSWIFGFQYAIFSSSSLDMFLLCL